MSDMQRDVIVANFKKKDGGRARDLCRALKALGHRAFMTFDVSYHVHVNPPESGVSDRDNWVAQLDLTTNHLLKTI